MRFMLKIICTLTILCLVFLCHTKAEPCSVRGELRRVRSCPFCIFRYTLQVCADGVDTDTDTDLEWTLICFDDYWKSANVIVYCRQNNYTGVSEDFVFGTSFLPYGEGVNKLENVMCEGSEANLLDCDYGITKQECLFPLYTPSNDCTNDKPECFVPNCVECSNGGTCSSDKCVCSPGFSGECCQTELQTELSNSTVNSSLTTQLVRSFTTTAYTSNLPEITTSRTTLVSDRPVSITRLIQNTNSTALPAQDSTKLLLILLTSIFGGLFITIALCAMFTLVFALIIVLSRSKPAKSTVANYEIPCLSAVNSADFNASTAFNLSSSVAIQNTSVTSNDIQTAACVQEQIYDELLISQGTRIQAVESEYNHSLEENSLYGAMVEGETGDLDLYRQYHRINCEIYDRIVSVGPVSLGSESGNEYYTMQDRLYYVEPPTSLPQLEDVFEQCFNEINRGEIEMGKEFASGQFGVVYRAVYHTQRGDIPVAIKTLKETSDTDTKVAFMREAAILAQFQHPNVLRLIGVLTAQQPYMMVTELLKTELAELLLKFKVLLKANTTTNNNNNKNSSGNNSAGDLTAQKLNLPNLLLRFAQEIAAGMQHLSDKHFIHRDLAARNVLVAKDLSCRIADFGMSRELISDSEYYTSSGGRIPLRWTAPEAIFYKKYSEKSDVWSFGMTLFEIWSLGEKPWGRDATNEEIIEGLSEGRKLSPPTGCPRDVYSVMVETWRMDASSRPTLSTILHLLTNIRLSTAPPLSPETDPSLCLGNDLVLSKHHFPDFQQMY